MNIQTELRDDHQARLTVEIDQSTFEDFKKKAARQIAREANIPGFRPGKAPYDVVRRIYGDDAIAQQAVETLIDQMYPAILEEAKIEPGAAGALEDIASMDPLKLVFLVPLEPEVDLGDYQTIRLPYEPESVPEEDVEKVITRLRDSQALAEPVERAAENGDLVAVEVNAILTNPDDGQEANIITNEHVELVVGDQTETWPVPGFSNNLAGLSAGSKTTVPVIFPEDEENDSLRGKSAEFHLEVESVKKRTLPEANDEWAQSIGKFQTIQDLRDDIRHHLERTQQGNYDDEYFDRLIAAIIAGAKIKYPPQVLDEEIDHLLEHISHDLEHQHMDLDTYLKMLGLTHEAFIETEVRPAAIRRLEQSLVIKEIGRVESIEIQAEDMNEVAQEAIQTLVQFTGAKSLRKIPNNVREQVTMKAMLQVLNRRILQRMKAIATGEAEKAESTPALDAGTTSEAPAEAPVEKSE
ncbi:MAG TPA: trigger factor [Anaerolineaceae bacterium]|nr:trigger factor [Anaerolineaceae bacterium]